MSTVGGIVHFEWLPTCRAPWIFKRFVQQFHHCANKQMQKKCPPSNQNYYSMKRGTIHNKPLLSGCVYGTDLSSLLPASSRESVNASKDTRYTGFIIIRRASVCHGVLP
jgi:hypothetical protein